MNVEKQARIERLVNASIHPAFFRSSALVLLLALVDMFMLIPIFADPFDPLYRDLLLLPIGLINLYTFVMVINPYKKQKGHTFFWGVLTGFISIGYLVLTQKFVYSMMKSESPLFLFISIGLYALTVIVFVCWIINTLGRPTNRDTQGRVPAIAYGAFGGLGMFSYGVLTATGNATLVLGVFTGVYLLLGWIFLLLSVMMFTSAFFTIRNPELFVNKVPFGRDRTRKKIRQGGKK